MIRQASDDWREWARWQGVLRTVEPFGHVALLCGLVGLAYALVAHLSRAARIISAVALSALFIALYAVMLGSAYESAWQLSLKDSAQYGNDLRAHGEAVASTDFISSSRAPGDMLMAGIGVLSGGVLLLWRCRRLSNQVRRRPPS